MTLYHYCSNVSFISIVRSQSIWASEFSLSNDALEGKWIRKILEECCEDRGLSWFEAIDILRVFDNEVLSFLGAAGFCMSEDGDLLSQWRGYADDGQGVSIGFDDERLKALGKRGTGVANASPSLQKIEYEKDRQKAQIQGTVDHIIDLWKVGAGRTASFLNRDTEDGEKERAKLTHDMKLELFQLSSEIYSFKNPAFREEREWRLVSTVTPGHALSNVVGPFNHTTRELPRMDFRAMKDRVVPYMEIGFGDLAIGAITEVITGPKNITPDRIIWAALLKYGWGNVKVRRSEASYR